MSRRSDLYFMLNPALGIIKIGIAGDVNERRCALEHGCGVALEVLRIVPQGEEYEVQLHDLFGASRLMGEWFAPTEDLCALALGKADVGQFIKENAAAIAIGRNAREAEMVRRKAEADAAARAETERAAALRAEEKRLKKEREAATAAAQKKRDEARRRQQEEARERAQAERDEMMTRERERYRELNRPDAAASASERKVIWASQRMRNAAMVGTTPILNPNQTERPRQEGEAVGVSQ